MFRELDDNRKNFIENKFETNCFQSFPKPKLEKQYRDDGQIEELYSRQKSTLQEQLNKLLHNVYNLEYVSGGGQSHVFTGMRVFETQDQNFKIVNKHIPCAVKISKGTISNLLCLKQQEFENNQRNSKSIHTRNQEDALKKEQTFEGQQTELESFNKEIQIVEQLEKLYEIGVRDHFSKGFYYLSFGTLNYLETIILEDTTTCVIMEKLAIDLYGLSKVESISDSMKSMFYDTNQKHIEINFLRLMLQVIKILNFFHYSGLIGNQRKEPMIHCDIKGKNIMILEQDSKFQVKFIDLGFTILERDNQNSVVPLSKGYVSQEIKRYYEISNILKSNQIQTHEEYMSYQQELNSLFPTKADDIWSIGVTIFHLFANFSDGVLDQQNCSFLQYCTPTGLHNLFENNLKNQFQNKDYRKYQRKSDSPIFKAGAEILKMIFSASREERNRPNFLNPIVDCLNKWETQAQTEASLIFQSISEEEKPPNAIIHGGAKSGIYTNIAAFLYDMRIFFQDLAITQGVENSSFYKNMKKFLMEYEQNNQAQYFTKLDFLNILVQFIQYISNHGVWIKVQRQNLFIVAQTLYIANLYSLEFETKSKSLHTSVFYIQPYSAILKLPIIENLRKIESLFTLNLSQNVYNSH